MGLSQNEAASFEYKKGMPGLAQTWQRWYDRSVKNHQATQIDRQFLCRGTDKVMVEWSILAIAANIIKLHSKFKNNRLGTGLVIPDGFPEAE